MAVYIGIVHKDPDSDFGISFPDFPGCVSAASTLNELGPQALEALSGHVAMMIKDGDPIPEPSDLETVLAHPDFADGMPVLIRLPVDRAKSVRLNITLPKDLLDDIDRATANRSRFLADAARRALRSA